MLLPRHRLILFDASAIETATTQKIQSEVLSTRSLFAVGGRLGSVFIIIPFVKRGLPSMGIR